MLVIAEHERSYIQRFALAVRHPRLLMLYELDDCLEHILLFNLRKSDSLRGVVHTSYVLDRAEHLNAAVRASVSLKSLENLRAVVEYGCRGVQSEV